MAAILQPSRREALRITTGGAVAAVLRKALHDSRRMILWLAIGLGLYALFIMAYYPTIIDQSEKYDELLESYPKEMLAMFYSGDPAELSFSEPGNWVHGEFMLWTELIMGAMVIAQAFNSVTNAERDNTLDVMLSFPVSRRAYLVGRILNTAITILLVLTACFLVFVASKYLWPEFDVSLWRLALGIYGAFLPLMVVAGFTYLLATVVPSSRHFAGALAYLFLMGSYLVYSFALAIDKLHVLQPVFLFDYYNSGLTIREGADLPRWGVLAAVALAYIALAWWRVDKKELVV